MSGPLRSSRWRAQLAHEDGQALLLLVAAIAMAALAAFVAGAVARGFGKQGRDQRAADLAALSAARAMRGAYPRLFSAGLAAAGADAGLSAGDPAGVGGAASPLDKATYLALGRDTATQAAAANGAHEVTVSFPDASSIAPVRVRVVVRDPVVVATRSGTHSAPLRAAAEAELAPPVAAPPGPSDNPGELRGPFSYRQGKPMRPDTALAFDRMEAAARADGVSLIVVSAFRSDAEQAVLFAQHPDPKWVAPPGKSLHRLGTELDLGPPSAYPWLYAHSRRYGFIKRYAWEPWHFGYTLNPGSTSVGFGIRRPPGERGSAVPSFVPARFAPMIARAAQRWNVSAALLAAQLYAESDFNPFSVSSAGAKGIAQFTPETARQYGLRDPFNAAQSIDAQGHLMRDLLRQLGSVPLALAAYNAGTSRVAACGCIPPIAETRAYVAKILGLLGGAGEAVGAVASGGLEVRLVR